MIDDRMSAGMALLLERLTDQPVVWALTGSLGHALQGLPVTPRDIDIQTDAPGAYAIERIFADLSWLPVRYIVSKRIRSHLGKLRIQGISIEIMGDVEKRLPDGSWTRPPRLPEHIHFADLDGQRVPVLSLDYEARAYELLGRQERARMLRDWLAQKSHLPPAHI